MTSNVKLLPPPEKKQLANPYLSHGATAYGHTDETMQAYARACVEANTEALRAEVAAVKRSLSTELRALRAERDRAMESCQLIGGHLITAEARAERLAEALREIVEFDGDPNTPARNSVKKSAIARAALHPAATQEDGND